MSTEPAVTVQGIFICVMYRRVQILPVIKGKMSHLNWLQGYCTIPTSNKRIVRNCHSQPCTVVITNDTRLHVLFAKKVKKDIGDVSILVNNAGVITAADLLSTQDHQIEKMFEVNILAHIWVRASSAVVPPWWCECY